MRLYLLFINSLLFLMVWTMQTGCNHTPRKSDIRQKIKGVYCNENHKLTLNDSTYTNVKFLKGVISQTQYQESCSGKYYIDMKDERWILRFEKDPHPNSTLSCQQEYTLWTNKEGYLIGEKEVILREPFDNSPVTRKNCP